MDDSGVLERISDLVEEERRLRDEAAAGAASQERLHLVETQLDQCWDLLRQRRGRRHAGADPDEARVRDAATVERYQQ
jgi:hypothetical protein